MEGFGPKLDMSTDSLQCYGRLYYQEESGLNFA